jgi:TraY domain
MSTDTTEVVIPTTIRLDPVLRRQLEDAARSSFRPLSQEIAFRLAQSLKSSDRGCR